MAELNFPANPQINDEYTFNNLLYKYDGEKWTTWGSGTNTALDLRNELASTQGASMVVTASGNTVQEELDMVGSGLSLEPLRRSYAEAGFDMDISESFALGGTLDSASEVLLGEGLIGYSWGGTFPKVVPPNSTPLDTGGIGSAAWIDQSNNLLRAQAKSYIDNGFVAKAGDTMTGALRLKTSGDNADLHHIRNDDTLAHTIRYVESLNLTQFVARDSAEVGSDYIAHYHETGDTVIKQPHSKSPQGTAATSLTRKDYVDGVTRGLHLQADLFDTYVVSPGVPGMGGYVPVELPELACDVLFRGYTQTTGIPTGVVIRASNYGGAGWVVTPIFGTTNSGNYPTIAVDPNGVLCFHNLHDDYYTYTWVYQVVSQTSRLANPFLWEESLYHPGNPPTALEVGAISREEFDSVVGGLLTRIEVLETINNTPTA